MSSGNGLSSLNFSNAFVANFHVYTFNNYDDDDDDDNDDDDDDDIKMCFTNNLSSRIREHRMQHKQFHPAVWLVCLLIVTTSTTNGATTLDTDSSDTLLNNTDFSRLNLLEFLDNFDVQKTIRDLQKDGTLLDFASSLAVGSFEEYPVSQKCIKDMLTTFQALFDQDEWAINCEYN